MMASIEDVGRGEIFEERYLVISRENGTTRTLSRAGEMIYEGEWNVREPTFFGHHKKQSTVYDSKNKLLKEVGL